jgi:hypothetical protein
VLNDDNFPSQVKYCKENFSKFDLGYKGWKRIVKTMTRDDFNKFVESEVAHKIVDESTLTKLQKSIGLPVTMSDYDSSNNNLIADHESYYEELEENLVTSREHTKMFLQFLQRNDVDVQSLLRG